MARWFAFQVIAAGRHICVGEVEAEGWTGAYARAQEDLHVRIDYLSASPSPQEHVEAPAADHA